LNLLEKINLIAEKIDKVGIFRTLVLLIQVFVLKEVFFSSEESGTKIAKEVLSIIP
jgi:hypothetical protein